VNGRGEVWRRRLGLWLAPLLFFAANLVALAVFRLNFAGESAGLERRLADREQQLAAATAERQRQEELVLRAEANRRLVEELYGERFATRERRLTRATEEVKELARRAGLVPRSISYPEETIEEFALVERAFVFTVEGSYEELRTFLNFLELSPSFLTLKQVSLAGSHPGGEALSINLTLATLFAQDGRPPGAEPGEPRGAAS
jgi:Tfp pilus assembly protein PilO